MFIVPSEWFQIKRICGFFAKRYSRVVQSLQSQLAGKSNLLKNKEIASPLHSSQ